MPRVWFHTKFRQKGFSPLEVLLAGTVFGFLVVALIGAIVYGRESVADSGDRNRAVFLAEEGLEATRNIAAAGYANLTSGGSNVGNTAIETSSDSNSGGTSAYKITTSTTGGMVASVSIYIKTVDSTNKNVQAAIYADNGSGTSPTTLLGASAIQTATANAWNSFSMSGVTVAANTTYWIGLSENGATAFADNGSGGTSAYRLTGGYPAPSPFAADSANTVDRPSFYLTIASTQGLAQVSNQWTFQGTSDITDIFTRQIAISDVSTNRKKVTSTVSWPSGGGTSQVSLDTYMTNWLANIIPPTSWNNAIVAGTADATSTLAGLKVATLGNYAYLVRNGTTNNFIIANISNPAAPTIVSTTTISGTPADIDVDSRGFAYITTTTATSGLLIYNVSNPAAPSLTKTLAFTGTAAGRNVEVVGNYAYVTRVFSSTTNSFEFNVVDVTTPASAALLGGFNNAVTMNDMWISGTNAYVTATTSATTQAEMVVLSLTNPAAPSSIGTYNPTGVNTALAITGVGNTVYLGYGTTLNSVNVTTPTAPTSLGTLTMAGTIQQVDTNGSNYAFVGTNSTTGEFQVVNIATPASMTVAKTVDVSGTASAINGLSYNASLDSVAGASANTAQELQVFTKG